jgi:hypothetical protein
LTLLGQSGKVAASGKAQIEGGDLSQYGLINAVTRTAEDAKSYDCAIQTQDGR